MSTPVKIREEGHACRTQVMHSLQCQERLRDGGSHHSITVSYAIESKCLTLCALTGISGQSLTFYFNYTPSPLSVGHSFRDAQRMPETADSTKYLYYVFSYTYIYMIKFNL